MALQKQTFSLNFSSGVDTKTDPYQLPFGKFRNLNNAVFDTAKRLTKRNGFNKITTLPTTEPTNILTYNDNLVATGSNLYTYNTALKNWSNKGSIQPIQLETKSVARASANQATQDMAVSDSGLVCLAWVESSTVHYQIFNIDTGQLIVNNTSITNSVGSPRVFLLGRYFIVTFMSLITATPHLQYISIPILSPSSPSAAQDLSTTLASTDGYDGYVANNNLYLAWADTGSVLKVTKLSSTLSLASATSIAASVATNIAITADITGSNPIIWIAYWSSSGNNGYITAYSATLNSTPLLAPVQILTSTVITQISVIAENNIATMAWENSNSYAAPYPTASTKTDYVTVRTCTLAGTLSTASIILRSVGLASKIFKGDDGTYYVVATYGETNQPTYFLIDLNGNIYMKLAYSNGGGYKTSQVLPTVSNYNDSFVVPYQFKDFLASVNKSTNLPTGSRVNGIYTTTGINIASFSINASNQYSSEIAGALHLTGGFLWEFDGVKPVEHGFHVYPENVAVQGSATSGSMASQFYFYTFTYEWTDNAGRLHRSAPSIPVKYTLLVPPVSFTGNRTSGSPIITGVSSMTGLQVGQGVTGTGIPGGTHILSIDSATQLTLTANASSGTATSTTLTPTGVTSVSVYVPTLRLTVKSAINPVRLVGYRWSDAQQAYYQFTSITSPNINNPAVDYLTISDTNSDAQILGNTLLYTTGGVVENIAAPAAITSTLFKNRLFLASAEDRNLIWYSKPVIEGVPVEMSDLFTLYVAPTSGAQGSTGPITALSAMDDKLIIFKQDAIYYLTGIGPDITGASNDFTDPVFITGSVGCSNPSSIVLMPQGLMFQSDKGIWLLSRDLNTQYIGADVEGFNSQSVMSAETIPGTNQVRFILDNSTTLMYDYYYQQWGTFSNIKAISATLYQGYHTYLNAFGQVLQETPGSYLDNTSPVLMSFTTSWMNLAGLQGYERFYFLYLLGTYYSPFKLNVQLSYDYNGTVMQSVEVVPDAVSGPWGDEALWGSGSMWGGASKVFEARVFPAKQKCESFQITVNEVYDASYGIAAGQGLTLSGVDLVVGTKKGYRTNKGSRNFG